MKTIEELAREVRNAYHREWRKKNPDKVKRNLENYWRRKAEQLQAERSKKGD